jgi:hypothetical protein
VQGLDNRFAAVPAPGDKRFFIIFPVPAAFLEASFGGAFGCRA